MGSGQLAPRAYNKVYAAWALQLLQPVAGKVVLEIGMSDGFFAEQLRLAGVGVVGGDVDAQAAARALTRSIPAVALDARDLPVRRSSVDAVAMFDVLEHVRAPHEVLLEIGSVLRPGGDLLLTTPNLNGADRFLHPATWSGVADPGHLYLWSSPALRHLVERSGFVDVRIRTPAHGLRGLAARAVEAVRLGGQLLLTARSPE